MSRSTGGLRLRPGGISVVAALLAAIAAVALLAMWPSGGTAATSSPKCGKGTGKAATGTPIPVGGMMTNSGGGVSIQGPQSAKAYFDCLNANGGIKGRPVEYTYVDDGLDPATTTRVANELVADHKVVGIAGSTGYLECTIAGAIYAKANVHELESGGGPEQCFTSPNINSVTQGGILSISLSAQALIKDGAKRVAMIAPNVAGITAAFKQAAARTSKANGAKLVKTVTYKTGIKDATSLLLAVAASKPQGIVVVGIKQDVTTMLKAAQTQRMKGKYTFASPAPMYAPEVPKALGSYWEGGALKVAHQFSSFEVNSGDNRLWHQVMSRYAKGVAQDELSQGGFLAAKMLADAVAKISGPVTASSVAKALKGIKNYKTNMLCRPWTWASTGKIHVANRVGRVAQIKNGKWQDVGGCTAINDPILKQ